MALQSQGSPPDRRSGSDRRAGQPRRSGSDRRKAARRGVRGPLGLIDVDRRDGDRRREQRRGFFDRRSRIGRRSADRREAAPRAFSLAEIREIRRRVAQSEHLIACPRCDQLVPVDHRELRPGSSLWDLHCSHCNLAAMLTRAPETRILVIDDDPIVRDTLVVVLSQAGHIVSEAEGAEDGLAHAFKNPVEVAFVDIELPRVDGIEVTRRLLKDVPQIEIVAMASQRHHGTPDPLSVAKRIGANQTLRKPFNPTDLLKVLDIAIAARRNRIRLGHRR